MCTQSHAGRLDVESHASEGEKKERDRDCIGIYAFVLAGCTISANFMNLLNSQ